MTPNLLGMRINHRAMRADSRRLATVMNEIAAGEQQASPARLAAINEFAAGLCTGIHHHHRAEDDILWPVIVRSAGAEVDLSDLSDDHAALDPLMEEITATAATLGTDAAAPRRLAKALTTLADLLDEHIEEEERLVFPVILKYVSVADWAKVEEGVRKGSKLSFEVPRIAQYASPEELAELRREAGLVLRILLRLLNPGHQRRQRLIFG
ncbi:hemerythrin domain-containing protein [Nonomuraea zeae]|uniref:Hemerythrin domain-containing protein n=1 Tax=Nonomuraea zeae TaxID=1642303 RepID=A0A5S4GF39_9ACTN|nr:hemerythrin domain-containing protein [Nonomuraea zeae]TMR31598.1 hemerythrin domain-containing protein [Nonomuraea zeae]